MLFHKFKYIFAFIVSMILATTFCFSLDDEENNSVPCSKLRSPKTDVSGVFRFQYTPIYCDTAFSILGELGSDNYRANLTVAQEKWDCLRYKLTGEYLAQRHQYQFANSSKKKWIQQGAGGLATQYLFTCSAISSLDFAADYSYAFGKDISSFTCNNNDLRRKIVGSNAYNIRGGATLPSYFAGLFSFWINYDCVKYQREFHNDKAITGVGGGFLLDQPISNQFGVVVLGDVKKPYQYYELQINWQNCACGGLWKVGAYTSYTYGRHGLNNDAKIGAQICFGQDSGSNRSDCCQSTCCRNTLSSWASIPAVYRPIVLAIAEQQPCTLPAIVGNPPTVTNYLLIYESIPMDPFDFSQFVTGSNLTYALSNQPNGINIDPVTGIISGVTGAAGPFIVTVTITNPCGSIQYQFQLYVQQTA